MSPNTVNTDIWCYTAYIFCSLFYVGEGNNRTTKRRNKILDDVKKYCRAMGWFDRKQKHMCTKNPEIIEIVQKAVKNALTECRRQFKAYRWNCSPLTWTQVFSEGGILKRRKWYVFYCGLFHGNPVFAAIWLQNRSLTWRLECISSVRVTIVYILKTSNTRFL